MGVIAQWGDIVFQITSQKALLLKELKISAEAETDDKTKNKQKYVSLKNGKPASVNFDVEVHSVFGQDVSAIVKQFLNAAQRGKTGYFYIGGQKVFPAKTMMTKAEASEIELSPTGKYVRAKIAVTLTQADAAYIVPDPAKEKKSSGGGGGGGGSGSSKASVKTQNAVVSFVGDLHYTPIDYHISSAASTSSTAKTATSAVTSSVKTNTANTTGVKITTGKFSR